MVAKKQNGMGSMRRRDRGAAPLPSPGTPLEVHLQSEALPDELLLRIMTFLPFRTVVGSFGPTNKMFLRATNVEWFCKNVRELTVVPSVQCPSLAEGLAHAANTRELWILPGVYRDSIRVTKNISVSGVGKLGSVVVEAPGWNDAIYFAGLGMDGEYVNPKTPDTGELADISNLVFRAPNPEQGFIAHIVRGAPRIHHCELQGGIWISGCKPKLNNNTIRWSRSCGVKITDRAAPELSCNVILNNKFGGIKVKRSSPQLTRNIISHNQSYGMVITTDSSPLLRDNEIEDQPEQPKFNFLTGVYGPLETPQLCGFCGSRWMRRNNFSDVNALLAQGDFKSDEKVEPSTTGFTSAISNKVSSFAAQHAAEDQTSNHVSIEDASSLSCAEEANPAKPAHQNAAYFNHCCWVEPGEISSDDDQLYGDDDLGNL